MYSRAAIRARSLIRARSASEGQRRAPTAAALLAVTIWCCAPVANTAAAPPELKPDWTRTFEAGVEWCAPVGAALAAALLVCTKDSRLDLIDVGSGRRLFAKTIPVQPGARFAGDSGNVAFCYGPTYVYALRIRPANQRAGASLGVVWRVAAASKAQTEGDPEFLTRLVAAKPTPRGVMIVRSDGRVAELARDDGALRWRRDLPDMANCKLHVLDSEAALMWGAGESFNVAFFDLTAKNPRPAAKLVNRPLPIWSALAFNGLAVAWRERFGVVRRASGLDSAEWTAPASAANIAVCASRDPRELARRGKKAPRTDTLVSYDSMGALRAYDLQTLTRRWLSVASPPGAPPPRRSNPTLRLAGDYMIAIAESGGVFVYEAGEDRLLAIPGCGGAAISGGVFAKHAYALCLDDRDRVPGDSRTLCLFRQRLTGGEDQQGGTQSAPARSEFHLRIAGNIRDTFWLGDKLVVIENRRARAYTLP